MIRFVIRRKMLDRHSSLASEGLETVDCECPELERVLMGGGTDMDAYDHRELAGAEVLPKVGAGETARIGQLETLLKEARTTFEMWKDVAPAVSLCADIDKALMMHNAVVNGG